ncbi:hypothetical protein [Devosia sp.]|uniref:hypothetical protein n=1 Tax=Devosia sp. TaxID=1871048 RepID=UPI003BA8BF9E
MPSNMPPGPPARAVVGAMQVKLIALSAGFLCTLAVLMLVGNMVPKVPLTL